MLCKLVFLDVLLVLTGPEGKSWLNDANKKANNITISNIFHSLDGRLLIKFSIVSEYDIYRCLHYISVLWPKDQEKV
jgi:hypothetical protein